MRSVVWPRLAVFVLHFFNSSSENRSSFSCVSLCAEAVITQIKKGGNFEKIAAQKSQDPESKDKGGDLDWAPGGRYVPAFSDALKKLKKGQITDTPVQTQFGWHVIRVDDERAMKFPPLEEVKPQIVQGLQRQSIEKMITDLRGKAKVE